MTQRHCKSLGNNAFYIFLGSAVQDDICYACCLGDLGAPLAVADMLSLTLLPSLGILLLLVGCLSQPWCEGFCIITYSKEYVCLWYPSDTEPSYIQRIRIHTLLVQNQNIRIEWTHRHTNNTQRHTHTHKNLLQLCLWCKALGPSGVVGSWTLYFLF